MDFLKDRGTHGSTPIEINVDDNDDNEGDVATLLWVPVTPRAVGDSNGNPRDSDIPSSSKASEYQTRTLGSIHIPVKKRKAQAPVAPSPEMSMMMQFMSSMTERFMAFEERQAERERERESREEVKRAKLADDMRFTTLMERISSIVREVIEGGLGPSLLQMIEHLNRDLLI